MSFDKKINSTLISVYNKTGLDIIVKKLADLEVDIYSSGGTQIYIEQLNIQCKSVESVTGYPSILNGRVKTLHPKIMGGILSRRSNGNDAIDTAKYLIPTIDLVIVDLYPFDKAVDQNFTEQEIIEHIDIGGSALIRAAAKNYNDVVIISSIEQYNELFQILESQNGVTSLEQRRNLAKKAFAISAYYDTKIFQYFDGGGNNFHDCLRVAENINQTMRYGENPHQRAMFFGNIESMFDKLNGKDLSYNNILDVDAAINLINEFSESTFIIVKHTNVCGVACDNNLLKAWQKCLACDPISAYGGVIITNRTITKDVAQEINSLFSDVIIAPNFSDEAIDILATKKNRIILCQKNTKLPTTSLRSALNGFLYQDRDLKTELNNEYKIVTDTKPNQKEIESLVFANKIAKHCKSTAIVLAKDNQMLALGVGQTARIDALKIAIDRAKCFGFDINNAVLASDGFFTFDDCVKLANQEGIVSIIQPGGSIHDNEIIDFCNKNNISMLFTGNRHLKL
ncbi:MAG: bifunctional phosphoribosylaminoimidazolecarboxamide formyltransferase/IMP cyclohydrolase [Bacteroidales bacterium]|nr:bifunctional phosphoribosylaminoimidazolecarboxamide formyltransferase/IMP cyclohydrolase [Bacteroidales bacterium]